MGAAISVWVAEERNRISGQELSEAEETLHVDLVRGAKEKELNAWTQFKVFKPRREGRNAKAVLNAMWELTWKMIGGRKNAKAHLVAMGHQDPDPREGAVDSTGCVSMRSSHMQAISLGGMGNGGI